MIDTLTLTADGKQTVFIICCIVVFLIAIIALIFVFMKSQKKQKGPQAAKPEEKEKKIPKKLPDILEAMIHRHNSVIKTDSKLLRKRLNQAAVIQFNMLGTRFLRIRSSAFDCSTEHTQLIYAYYFADGLLNDTGEKKFVEWIKEQIPENQKKVYLALNGDNCTISYEMAPKMDFLADNRFRDNLLSSLNAENEITYLTTITSHEKNIYRFLQIKRPFLDQISRILNQNGKKLVGCCLQSDYLVFQVSDKEGISVVLTRDMFLISIFVLYDGVVIEESTMNSSNAKNIGITLTLYFSKIENRYQEIKEYYIRDSSEFLQKAFQSIGLPYQEL